jgi:hypothetical protein
VDVGNVKDGGVDTLARVGISCTSSAPSCSISVSRFDMMLVTVLFLETTAARDNDARVAVSLAFTG